MPLKTVTSGTRQDVSSSFGAPRKACGGELAANEAGEDEADMSRAARIAAE
jgi:hypothetical protein